MPTRIGYSRDTGLWVLKDGRGKITNKVGGFILRNATGEVILESSIEPTPAASKANYGDYNAMMDIPDEVSIELIQDTYHVEWKDGICPVCNKGPE